MVEILLVIDARDEIIAAIRAAFHKTEGSRLAPVKEILGLEYTYDEIHLVRVGMSQEGYFAGETPTTNNA